MRKTEQLKQAWPALLRLAEKSPVTITYRGVDKDDKPLYEIVNRKGETICLQGTEKQVLECLKGETMMIRKGGSDEH